MISGGGARGELAQGSVLQCGGHKENLKRGAEARWQGSHARVGRQWHDNKETRVKAQVRVQLHRKNRKWHSKGIVRPNPQWLAKSLGLSLLREAGWGLDGQE